MRHYLLAALAFLVLNSCGKSTGGGGEPVTPPTPPAGDAKYTLRVFGAPWCTECKKEFPEIRDGLKDVFTGTVVKGELYVVSNSDGSEAPVQSESDAYRDFLKLPFPAINDPWKWKTFKLQVQKEPKLPGAVVMDAAGNILKVFKPAGFSSSEVISYVKGLN